MYPQAYINYLVHFHGDRDYFECHEILEEYWKSVDKNNKSSIWVGLILFAVSHYHHRRGNFKGAERTMQKSINILGSKRKEIQQLGIDEIKLLMDLNSQLQGIAAQTKYKSYTFPFSDPQLIEIAKQNCIQEGFIWCQDSDLLNEDLIHRHVRRDRSDVIKERSLALNKGINEDRGNHNI
ncbi:DUF309 domain-containing protein [Cytobacillus purgationiresistens]|uniref:Metal-dependent hydrolase n=1 Tax=Cytobacillus purgationiresistens TaxID=863449 RepID=A0ABU0AGT9_9BACI|nr:DUF309 domain-containing protein [Cytobacillus purgationiresistens]MDQ0269300.1 putative metal-dependent hydrolase [Cytobacillus purgationiresistens]